MACRSACFAASPPYLSAAPSPWSDHAGPPSNAPPVPSWDSFSSDQAMRDNCGNRLLRLAAFEVAESEVGVEVTEKPGYTYGSSVRGSVVKMQVA